MTQSDFHAVALDETRYCRIDAADAPYIDRIFGVYVYDAAEYTYCCELMPSHWLEPVYTTVHCKPDTPDDIREALQEKYAHCGMDGYYMHVRSVPTTERVRYGKADSIDDVREYYQGNCPW